jgi:hypothetical protein
MNYEKLDSGLLVPKGVYKGTILRKGEIVDEFEFENICVNEGLIFLLNTIFASQQNVSGWYMGLFTNNYTPVATDTAATITGNAGEFTGYSGGARPTFNAATAVQPTPSLSNSGNRASFTFTGTANLIGAFLVSSPTPGGTTGTLFSAAQFPSAKSVSNTDQLLLTYTLSASST